MRRPEKVTICGQPFTVEWVDAEHGRLHPNNANEDDLGTIAPSQQRIYIRAAQAPHSARDALLHETIHGVLLMTGQDDRFKNDDAQEQVVNALAVGLLSVLRGNPALVQWLMEAA